MSDDHSFTSREMARAKRQALADRDEAVGEHGPGRQLMASVTRDGAVWVVDGPYRVIEVEGDEAPVYRMVEHWSLSDQYGADVTPAKRCEITAMNLASRGYKLAGPFRLEPGGVWNAPITVRVEDRDETTRSLDRQRAMQNIRETQEHDHDR